MRRTITNMVMDQQTGASSGKDGDKSTASKDKKADKAQVGKSLRELLEVPNLRDFEGVAKFDSLRSVVSPLRNPRHFRSDFTKLFKEACPPKLYEDLCDALRCVDDISKTIGRGPMSRETAIKSAYQ